MKLTTELPPDFFEIAIDPTGDEYPLEIDCLPEWDKFLEECFIAHNGCPVMVVISPRPYTRLIQQAKAYQRLEYHKDGGYMIDGVQIIMERSRKIANL